MAEVSSSTECCTQAWKRSFARRSWSEASHLLNSVLWIRHHFASLLFNHGHRFSALRSSSQVSVLLNYSHNFSQLFLRILTSANIFSTRFNCAQSLWARLFWPLPTSSQLFSPLLTSSQLLSTMFTSASIRLPLLLPILLPHPTLLYSTLLNSIRIMLYSTRL